MPSYTSLLLPILASSVSAFMAPGVMNNRALVTIPTRPSSSSLPMAIDYNDPAVMEEFNTIQTMEYDEVVDELAQSGVRAPADMGDMDVKLMLVELRTVMKGGSSGPGPGDNADAPPPTNFGSKFEEYLWTKPVFQNFYEAIKAEGDVNKMNVAAEYCNEGADAKARYYDAYSQLIDDIDAALIAKPEVKSPTVRFSGFPANMGEAGLKMTLEAVGDIEDMAISVSDDGIMLIGQVTFGSIDIAKAAIDQYDGMDMGMGDALKMVSI